MTCLLGIIRSFVLPSILEMKPISHVVESLSVFKQMVLTREARGPWEQVVSLLPHVHCIEGNNHVGKYQRGNNGVQVN